MAKTKKTPKTEVRLEGSLAVGGTAKFSVDSPDGDITYEIVTDQGTHTGKASVSENVASVSKTIELAGPIEVTFLADGKEFASGSFE